MSKVEVFTLTSDHDGLSLSVMTVLPEQRPKALVQFSHGMAEHKERYLPVMKFLAENGFGCIINDHRGHGASVRSPEDLGYFYKDGGRGLVKDMHQVTLWFRGKHPGKPIVLVGHSMGSLSARAYAAQFGRDIDGLILSGSPGYEPMAKAGMALAQFFAMLHGSSRAKSPFLCRILNNKLAKRYAKESPNAWLSANKENVKAFDADPLCGFDFTLNGIRAELALMIAAYDTRTSVRRSLPVHFMSGEDDSCAPNRAGFNRAMENLKSRGCVRVTGKMYPGLRHEILNEGVQEVFDDLLDTVQWMTEKDSKE